MLQGYLLDHRHPHCNHHPNRIDLLVIIIDFY